MKKVLTTLCIAVLLMLLLCSCGRSDVTLTVNKDGSFDAEIAYGIEKAFVSGDDVMQQVLTLIKQPLDEQKIEYTEEDNEDFYVIRTKKHFENTDELTDSDFWEKVPFVPKFTKEPYENALLVTQEEGKITFTGNLNADSFNAGQIISENKAAYGASLKIVAEKAKANVKMAENEENAYIWKGDASENVKVELTVDLKAKERATQSSLYIYISAAIIIILAVIIIIIKKKKIEGNEKGEDL